MSRDFQQDMALLDCHGIDEPMFALVDLVAHVLVVDTGAHAVLAVGRGERATASSVLSRPNEDPMARLKAMPALLKYLAWRFATLTYTSPATRGRKGSTLRRVDHGADVKKGGEAG